MKKLNLLKWGFLCLFCALTTMVGATTYTCWFGSDYTVNGDGINDYDEDDDTSAFFVFTRKYSSGKYTTNTSSESDWGYVTYNNVEYQNGFKMEGDSKIAFTTTEEMVLTLIFGAGTKNYHEVAFESKGLSTTEVATAVYGDDGETVLYYELTKTLEEGEHAIYIGTGYKEDSETETESQQSAIFYISITSADEYGNGSSTGTATTAKWDWQNDLPSGIVANTNYEGNNNTNEGVAYVESTVAGLYMYVNVTKGKLNAASRTSNQDCQMNEGAILRIPVLSESDVITVTARSSYNYTIGGEAATGKTQTYSPSSTDLDNGYVEIVGTSGGSYLYSISIVYAASDDLDEIDEDFIRPSVSLVSPTQEDLDETPLANDTEIKVNITNLPDDPVVYFMLYDSDGDEVSGGPCTAEGEDGEYTYTWDYYFWEEQSLSNQTYTGKIMVYSGTNDSENLIYPTHTIFTTVGLLPTSDVTLDNIEPSTEADEDTGKATLTQNTITLTFSDKVTITNAYVNSYDTSGSTPSKTTVNLTPSDEAEANTIWTFTIDDETMETLQNAETGLTMIVSAQDESSVALYDGKNNYFTISYDSIAYTPTGGTVNGYDEVELTYSPDGTSEIYGGLVIKATYNYSADDYEGSVYLNANYGDGIRVIGSDNQEVEDVTIDSTTGDSDNECLITIDGLSAGTYNIIIDSQDGDNGEAFYVEVGDDYTKVAVNKADTLTYTITDELSLERASTDFTGLTPGNLSDCGEISVQTNDCGNLYVTLTITDDQDADNPLTYEMTCSSYDGFYAFDTDDLDGDDDITMYSDHNYTFTVNAYSKEGDANAIKTITLYTIAGATENITYSSVTVSISPDPTDDDLVLTTSDNTFTLTFSDAVTIDAESSFVQLGIMNKSYFTDDDIVAGDNNTWTITVPSDVMETIANNGADLNMAIKVTDSESNPLDNGYEDGYLHYTYSVEFVPTWTFNPADGETITSLKTITISCEDGIEFEDDDDLAITITKDGSAIDVEITCEDNSYYDATSSTITLGTEQTEAGTYVVTIPAGCYLVGEYYMECPETTLTYYVSSTDGINGITLKAGADDRFYNLNGQRVTAPRNGVYILNGKKVLIK